MNLIKATIATAAVITCCLGNTYPANAEIADRIAMKLCSEPTSVLRRANRNKAFMKTLVRSRTEQAMETYSDVLVPIREMGEYKDATSLGLAMYRSMKRQCGTAKANALFGEV